MYVPGGIRISRTLSLAQSSIEGCLVPKPRDGFTSKPTGRARGRAAGNCTKTRFSVSPGKSNCAVTRKSLVQGLGSLSQILTMRDIVCRYDGNRVREVAENLCK